MVGMEVRNLAAKASWHSSWVPGPEQAWLLCFSLSCWAITRTLSTLAGSPARNSPFRLQDSRGSWEALLLSGVLQSVVHVSLH